MQRWLSFLPAVLALAAGAAAFSLYSENRDLRARLAAVESGAAEAAPVAGPSSETTVVVPSNPAQDTSSATDRAEGASPAPPSVPPARTDRFDERRARGIEAMGRMLTDPEARAATLTRMKSQVDRMYGDLFVRLGLDEVQVETLRTLLAERQLAQMEAGFLMRSADSDASREEARVWRESKLAELDSGVNAILGEGGNEILQEYRESAPQRNAVAEISRRASYGGAPLDAAISDQLARTLRTAQQEYPVPVKRWRGADALQETLTQESVGRLLAQQATQNQAVLAEARKYLSQPQLEALADQQIEEYEALQQQLNFQMRNPDLSGGRGGFGGFRGGGGIPGRGVPPPGG